MAASKTKFVLEADPAEAVAALLKVADAQQTTINQMQRMNRAGKDAGQVLENAFKNAVSMLGVGGSIAGGLAFLQQQTTAWSEETQQVVQKFKDVNKELLLSISRSGDLANFAEIQGKLRTLSMPGIGPAERTGMYRALRAELPMENIETIMKLLQVAGKAKIMEEPTEFAARMGTTFQLYGGKLGAGDVADTTKIIESMLGGNAEKYGGQVFKEAMQLRASGMGPDKAAAMMIALAEQGQLTRGAGALTGLLTTEKNFGRRKPGQRFTPEEKAEREFYAIEGPQERLEWLMANRGRGGKAAAVLPNQGALEALSEVDTNAIAERIRKAREVDYFEKTRQLVTGTQPGSMLLGMEKAKVSVAEEEVLTGGKLAETDIARDMLRTAYLRRVRVRGAAPITNTLNKALLETEMFLGRPPEEALMSMPMVSGKGYLPSTQYLPPALLKSEVKEAFEGKTLPTKEIQELTRAIKDLTVIEKNKQNQNTIIINPGSGMLD